MHRASPNSLTNQGEADGIVMATEKKKSDDHLCVERVSVSVCVWTRSELCVCVDLVGTVRVCVCGPGRDCVCVLAGR